MFCYFTNYRFNMIYMIVIPYISFDEYGYIFIRRITLINS